MMKNDIDNPSLLAKLTNEDMGNLVIVGPGGSGKDTLVNTLTVAFYYQRIKTCTTRPPRDQIEVAEKTYHFLTENDFMDAARRGYFAEFQRYESRQGGWYYGSLKQSYEMGDSDEIYYKVIILTPEGISYALQQGYTVIYLTAPSLVLLFRMLRRGDNFLEAIRRWRDDRRRFQNYEDYAYKVSTFGRSIYRILGEGYLKHENNQEQDSTESQRIKN